MASVTISLATASDIARIAEIQRLAFASMAVQQACFGHVTAEVEDRFTAQHVGKALESGGNEVVWKAVLEGEIVGFAVWRLSSGVRGGEGKKEVEEESEEEKKERIKKRFPEGTDWELAATLFGPLGIVEPHFRECLLYRALPV